MKYEIFRGSVGGYGEYCKYPLQTNMYEKSCSFTCNNRLDLNIFAIINTTNVV